MEVDDIVEISHWEATHMEKNKYLVEQLAQECPFVFYDDSIALYHENYRMDSRKL
jgi:hypothetical protein